MQKYLTRTVLGLVAALLAPAAAQAQIGGDYGVLTFGSMSISNSSAGGRVAAGGAFQATNFGIGALLPAGAGIPTVVVGGSAMLTNGQVNNGGVMHAGAASINGVGMAGGSAASGTFLDFLALKAGQTELSASLAGLDATGSTNITPWKAITLTGSETGVNVFSLSASSFGGASSFTINAPASSTVIINVSGMSAQLQNFGFALNGVGSNSVLFNFFEASSLAMQSVGVQGSVLAPHAAVTGNSGNLHGDLVANSYAGTLAFQNQPFMGALPATSVVPEPATIVLVGGGLALLGIAAVRRRRR